MPVMISSTIKPALEDNHLVSRPGLDRLDVFRARRAQMLQRDARDPGERGVVFAHDARETFRTSAGHEPLDLALDHQRQHIFPAQSDASAG